MKQYFRDGVVLLVGTLLGGGAVWVSSYLPRPEATHRAVKLEQLLNYSNVQIRDENFSCEGETGKYVGAVVGSIFDVNTQHRRNMVSFDCMNQKCTLKISNCTPWSSKECGSRLLTFGVNGAHEITPSTFACLDVP